MLNDAVIWLDRGPSWLGLLSVFAAVMAARSDWPGAGSLSLAWLASIAALALVQALWRRAGSTRPAAPQAPAVPVPSIVRRDPGDRVVTTPGLDRGAVLDMARARFIRLQAAWDAGDVAALRSLTTPDMLAELMQVLEARLAPEPCRTDVVSLHAELLGLEELGAAWLASVEFSGLIRESAEAGAVPFRELWMLSTEKTVAGQGGEPAWLLARQQALL